MLIVLLTTGIAFLALLIIIAVLIQEGKGDMGLGSASRQVLFGGSGGQNILEKLTWIIGFLFMAIALGLTIAKTRDHHSSVVASYANSLREDGPLVSNTTSPVKETKAASVIAENTPELALPAEQQQNQTA